MQKAVKEGEQKQNVAYRSEPCWLTNPLHRIAARLRFCMNLKSLIWAANGDWAALGLRGVIIMDSEELAQEIAKLKVNNFGTLVGIGVLVRTLIKTHPDFSLFLDTLRQEHQLMLDAFLRRTDPEQGIEPYCNFLTAMSLNPRDWLEH
jgi:hypothetical protein